MRSSQPLSTVSQLLSVAAIEVVRNRSSDSTEPVHTSASKSVVSDATAATAPMTPPRLSITRNEAPANSQATPPRFLQPKTEETDDWRCKDTSCIFRLPSGSVDDIPDFLTIQRSFAFDEDDAEF